DVPATDALGPPAAPLSSPKKLTSCMPIQTSTTMVATPSAATPMASLRFAAGSCTGRLVVQTVPSSSTGGGGGVPGSAGTGASSIVCSSEAITRSSTLISPALVRMPLSDDSYRLRIAAEDNS